MEISIEFVYSVTNKREKLVTKRANFDKILGCPISDIKLEVKECNGAKDVEKLINLLVGTIKPSLLMQRGKRKKKRSFPTVEILTMGQKNV